MFMEVLNNVRMATILVFTTAILLFSLWLTYSICAIRKRKAKERMHAALFAQLDAMERSLDQSDREYQRERRKFRRELRKSQNPNQPATPKKPRPVRENSSAPTVPSRKPIPLPTPQPITLTSPKPSTAILATCTRFLCFTASYVTSLLRPIFHLPRTFSSLFTGPRIPQSTQITSPDARNRAA